jgi:peptidyl-prolyl cis-trans isomerase B (cyclophilin B)
MIQGGGFEPGMKQKATRGKIKNESNNGLSNVRGAVAMARTSEPDSATAQFFVNTVDNLFLDRAQAADKVGYCVFGKVIDGMDVIEAIRGVPTATKGGHGDVPVKDVVIQSVRRVEA